MKTIKPNKLYSGDTIMVIAPSRSLSVVNQSIINLAINRFNQLGLKVLFSKNVYNKNIFSSSSVEDRVNDINYAFKNKSVKAIFAAIGGYNVNQILDYLDWNTIKLNSKIICGFSDITILLNAIYTKTGLITFLGPNFASFGQKLYFDYTLDNFIKICFNDKDFCTKPSAYWSDDNWKSNQLKRKLIKNKGFYIINQGFGKGRIVGGNLCSFNLLQGTKYFPNLKNTILCLEDDNLPRENTLYEFDRNLNSLIQQKNFNKVKGILIGRFQKKSRIKNAFLKKLIKLKKELDGIPVIANLDFGHTSPLITLPIGGNIQIEANNNKVKIMIKQ